MAELTFSLAYEGPAVDDGTMDVRALAPALLALANIFRTANVTLNTDSPPVTLEINATSRGSFEVHLILSQPDIVSQLVALFSGDQATALSNLYGIVAGLGGTTLGLFGFIRWLAHRTVAKRESIDVGSIRVELQDGVTITIPAEVLALYDSLGIRRDAEVVVAPLNTEGVESMEIRRSTEQVSVRIAKADVPSFRAPLPPAIPLLDTLTELNLQVVAVSFQQGNVWRFSDGNRTFPAQVNDQSFVERVASSEEAFRSGDLLHVDLRVRQERAADGELRTFYSIERVIQHVAREPHTQLPLEPDQSD